MTPAPAISGPISTPSAASAIMAVETMTTIAMTLRTIGSSVCRRARRRASSVLGGPRSFVSASLRSITAFMSCQANSASSTMTMALTPPRRMRVARVSRAARSPRSIAQAWASKKAVPMSRTARAPRSMLTMRMLGTLWPASTVPGGRRTCSTARCVTPTRAGRPTMTTASQNAGMALATQSSHSATK